MSTTLSDPDKIKALAKELERYGKNICSSYRAEIRNTDRAISGASSKYYEYSSVTSKVREIQNLLRELERYSKGIEEKNYKLTKGLNNAVNMYRDSEKAMKKEADLSRSALDVSSLNTKVKQNSTKINEISERGKEAVLPYNAPEGIDPYQVNDCIRMGTSFINDKIDTVLSWAKELNDNLPLYAEEIKTKLDQFYEKLDDTAKKLVEDMKGLLDHIVTISSNYLEKLSAYATSFKEKLQTGINGVKDIIKQAGDRLGCEELADIINGVIDVRTGIFAKGIEEFSKIAAELRDILSLKGEQLKTMISDFYEKLKEGAQNLFEDMKSAVDKMGASISDKLTQLAEFTLLVKNLGEQALLKVEEAIRKFKENLEKDFKDLERAQDRNKDDKVDLNSNISDKVVINGKTYIFPNVKHEIWPVEIDTRFQPKHTGEISISGKTYAVYVPPYTYYKNTDYTMDGWETIEVFTKNIIKFDLVKGIAVASQSQYADDGLIPIPDSTMQLREGRNGKKVVNNIDINPKDAQVGAKAGLFMFSSHLISSSTEMTPIKVTLQQKGDQTRSVIEIDPFNGAFHKLAGKTIIKADTNKQKSAIKLHLDANHANDLYSCYLSKDDQGRWVVTPKTYPKDHLEYGTYNYSNEFTGASFQPNRSSFTFLPSDNKIEKNWKTTPNEDVESILKGSCVLDEDMSKRIDAIISKLD